MEGAVVRAYRKLMAIVALSALSGVAAAGPLEDAEAAFEQQDYATAMRIVRPLANQGDTVAEFDLGVLYQNGFGVPPSQADAAAWFLKSANGG